MLFGFLAATLTMVMLGQVTGSVILLLVTLFLAGFTVMGCQFGLNAMATASYETAARATGLGWALAIGRIGAIIGPVLVGLALAMDLHLSQLFMLGAAPMLVAGACVFLAGRLTLKAHETPR